MARSLRRSHACMPRRRERQVAGLIFHVVNRAIQRLELFETSDDYDACLRTLAEAQRRVPVNLHAYCLMPNHFHLVLQLTRDQDLSRFMHWFTLTHSKRWRMNRQSTGRGAVYQGRYKASHVEDDPHFLAVCRYVERNALRAKLVGRAEEWRWSSVSQRSGNHDFVRLAKWPVPQPTEWIAELNSLESTAETEVAERARARRSVQGRPLRR